MMTETKNNERVFTNRRERNYGIDLLRIVSMIMVTILHFSGYGGFLGTPENGLSYYVLSLIMVICYGAVDIFAIISGFVMYNSIEIRYIEKPARKITEIRIFFDDNTYETFRPEK